MLKQGDRDKNDVDSGNYAHNAVNYGAVGQPSEVLNTESTVNEDLQQ